MPSATHYQRSRGWCFTVNNYSDEDKQALIDLPSQYIVWGEEVGESGTPHLQGYIHFTHEKTMNTMKKYHRTAHWEKRMGSIKQAIEYCKKDNTNIVEIGTVRVTEDPKTTTQKWQTILNLAKEGKIDELEENFPREYVSNYSTLRRILDKKGGVLEGPLEHEWWVGPTGTGKSKKIWEDFPEHYQKQTNKWWDNYENEEIVVIEEWEPKNECTAAKLKIWCDRYPFPAEIKGGIIQGIRPRKIIVTSNYTIRDCFPNPNDYEPLERRFKIVQFGEPNHPPAFAPGFNIPPEDFNDILQPIDLDTLLQEDP